MDMVAISITSSVSELPPTAVTHRLWTQWDSQRARQIYRVLPSRRAWAAVRPACRRVRSSAASVRSGGANGLSRAIGSLASQPSALPAGALVRTRGFWHIREGRGCAVSGVRLREHSSPCGNAAPPAATGGEAEACIRWPRSRVVTASTKHFHLIAPSARRR
jgi:hypothetical protein